MNRDGLGGGILLMLVLGALAYFTANPISCEPESRSRINYCTPSGQIMQFESPEEFQEYRNSPQGRRELGFYQAQAAARRKASQ